MATEHLPPLYRVLREATEALAEAERRHSLRLSLEESLARQVRSFVERETQLRGDKIGIMPLAKLDIHAELARITGPQDHVPDIDPGDEGASMDMTVCREAIRDVATEADTLTETKETVEFARRVFDNALAAWESSLRSTDTEPARQLHRIDAKHAELDASFREIHEAIDAANKVSDALHETEKSLETTIALTIRKPTQLIESRSIHFVMRKLADTATPSLLTAQRWLILLDAEVDDIGELHRPTVEPPRPVRLALEQIPDAAFSMTTGVDWGTVRGLIQNGVQTLKSMRDEVDHLRTELTTIGATVEDELNALDVERWQLLLDEPFSTE